MSQLETDHTTEAPALEAATFLSAADADEWHALRRQGLGGSDAGAVLGVSPWTSPYALWAEKTGRVVRQVSNAATHWGTLLEPIVADEFARRCPDEVIALPRGVYRSNTHQFALATPDRLILRDSKPVGILEIKTANHRNERYWEDAPPVYYQAQVAWYQWVTGLKEGKLAVLIGGQDYREYDLPWEPVLGDALATLASAFWHHVETDTPPPVDGSRATSDALAHMFQTATDSVCSLDHLAELIHQRVALVDERDAIETRITEIDNRVKEALADATIGTLRGETVVTWRNVTTSRVDVTRLRRDRPEIASEYTTTTSSRRFVWKGSAD